MRVVVPLCSLHISANDRTGGGNAIDSPHGIDRLAEEPEVFNLYNYEKIVLAKKR